MPLRLEKIENICRFPLEKTLVERLVDFPKQTVAYHTQSKNWTLNGKTVTYNPKITSPLLVIFLTILHHIKAFCSPRYKRLFYTAIERLKRAEQKALAKTERLARQESAKTKHLNDLNTSIQKQADSLLIQSTSLKTKGEAFADYLEREKKKKEKEHQEYSQNVQLLNTFAKTPSKEMREQFKTKFPRVNWEQLTPQEIKIIEKRQLALGTETGGKIASLTREIRSAKKQQQRAQEASAKRLGTFRFRQQEISSSPLSSNSSAKPVARSLMQELENASPLNPLDQERTVLT